MSELPAAPETAFTSPDPQARRVFPARVAERHGIAPFALEGRELSVVTTDPPDQELLDQIGILLSLTLRPHVAPEARVRALVRELYGTPTSPASLAPPPAPPAAPEGAGSAEEAIQAALRAVRERFSYAAAFSVRRDHLAGQDALGQDPGAAEACRRVTVSLGEPGLFGAPLSTRTPYLGPPPSDPVTASILAGLGRVGPSTVLVAPVWLGERAACVIYADADDAPVPASRLDELQPVLARLGETLARLIRERKAKGAAGGKEAPPAPTIPRPTPTPARPAAASPRARPTPAPRRPRATPDDEWSIVELARAEPASTRALIDGDAIPREVIDAGEPLPPVRAEDVPGLVEALLASRRGSEERRDLLSHVVFAGPEAVAALVARLPGPVEAGGTLADGAPIAEWGPVFAGVAAAGLAAEKPLLAALHDPAPERRIAAVALVLRLGAPGGLAAIAALVQDDDPRVAAEAAHALASSRGLPVLAPVVAEIRRALASGRPVKASRAARALGRLGDADSVPVLIQMLDAGGDLTAAVSDALTTITMQRLGSDPLRWIHWWREWRAAPRSSWLFQALASPEPDLRRRAATELRRAGEPPLPFDPDGPEPDRRRAAQAWAAWWREAGLAL